MLSTVCGVDWQNAPWKETGRMARAGKKLSFFVFLARTSSFPILHFGRKYISTSYHDICNPNSTRRIGKPDCKLVIIGPLEASTFVPIHVASCGLPKLVRLNTL